MELNTVLITQARYGSTRLPGKILKEINSESLLEIHLKRLKRCKNISKIIVATTDKPEDKVIYDYAIDHSLNSFRGSESDVLDRFYKAVKNEKPDWIVRVTSDCPLIDPILVDKLIEFAHNNNIDYCSNTLIENYPDGQDIEVFKFSALKAAWKNTNLSSDREHVTPYIRNNSDFKGATIFKALNYPCAMNYSKVRMTVDEPKDFELIKVLIKDLGTSKTWLEYTNYIIKKDLNRINNSIIRNEGLLKSLKND